MKFDYAIGNPPYMEQTDSDSSRMPPVYNFLMDEAYKIAYGAELITPARFLFNAGYTPKQWNEKMLNDPHFKVLHYEPDCEKIFPGTDIKGGIAITYRDADKEFGAIGIFTKYEELNSILKKVKNCANEFLDSIISSPLSYKVSALMTKENPQLVNRLRTSAFTALADIFFENQPTDGKQYISMIGLLNGKRTIRYIRKDYIVDSSNTLDKFCLLLPKASGSGEYGETLSATEIAKPGQGYTQTFIGIGRSDDIEEIKNIDKYIKTKFARAMLGVLKITQDCPGPKWKLVPLQDFTPNSDINWSSSIHDVDQQLYKKYGLSQQEIDFIESHVKEMA